MVVRRMELNLNGTIGFPIQIELAEIRIVWRKWFDVTNRRAGRWCGCTRWRVWCHVAGKKRAKCIREAWDEDETEKEKEKEKMGSSVYDCLFLYATFSLLYWKQTSREARELWRNKIYRFLYLPIAVPIERSRRMRTPMISIAHRRVGMWMRLMMVSSRWDRCNGAGVVGRLI